MSKWRDGSLEIVGVAFAHVNGEVIALLVVRHCGQGFGFKFVQEVGIELGP